MKKKILLLLTLCLFSFSCGENQIAEDDPEYYESEIPVDGEFTDCDDCSCPEWIKKILADSIKQTTPALWTIHCMKINGVPYYAMTNLSTPSIRPNFFYSDETAVSKDYKNYAILKKLFWDGKFEYYYNKCVERKDDEEGLGCADCPCPEWAEEVLADYREQTPPQLAELHFMERNGELYYAIRIIFDSTLGPRNFYYSDGTVVGNDHEDYEALSKLFFEGKFRLNNPCSVKHW